MAEQMPPQGAPQAQAPMPPPPAGKPGGEPDLEGMVSDVSSGLGAIADVLMKQGNKDGAQKVASCIELLNSSALGGEESAAAMSDGNVDMNAGTQKVRPVL